jgi:hypothetical protein
MGPACLSLANRAKLPVVEIPRRELYTVLYLKVQGTPSGKFPRLHMVNPLSLSQFVPAHFHPALPRSLLGSSNMSVADANNETPATARPPYKLPVFWLIHPVAYGPANPPRFASELTKAIPEAAANPVRKSPGSE